MDASSAQVRTGKIEGQTAGTLSLSSLLGTYVVGSSDSTVPGTTFESGVINIATLGNLTGTLDTNDQAGTLAPGNLLSGTLSLSGVTNGKLTLGTDVYYYVSPTRVIGASLKAGNTASAVVELDQ